MVIRKESPSSVLTRSGRKTSTGIQASTNPLNTRKSPRFEKQMVPTTRSTAKKKPEKSEKQMGSTPLRRSERGKNPVDVPASNIKSTEKSPVISNGGSKKRKRYHVVEFKTRKSPRFQKQMGPTPSTVKKKSETSEKQMGSTRLRRSERGKNLEQPRMSPAVPLSLQEQKRENHGSSNEEALQSSGQILEKDITRKERNEIDKFDGEWDEKKKTIVNNFRLEKTLIRYLYKSNPSVRSDKLDLAEKQLADKLNAHERLRQVCFNDLKATLKPAVGQVVVNDGISLYGPAHETQIVDLTGSEKEDQESREVAPALLGNSIEAASHDKPLGHVSAKKHAGIDMAPNVYSTDVSQAVEDPNKNGSNDISLEYADGSHAVEDPNGTGPNHVAPNVESVELGIPAGNCNQEKAQATTPSVQQVASPVSDHSMPAISEIHNDPTPMVDVEDDNMQPAQAIQVDQIIPEDSSLNPHNETSSVMSANPLITENQAAMLPTSEVLAQTTAAQTQIQRNANFNQVGSQMHRRVDPLRIELEQLSSINEKMVKSYHHNIQKINIDCEKEIAEAVAEVRLKYCNKRQEAIATFNSQKKEIENNMKTVVINQVLAATFRQKCQDVSRGCVALQQGQAESMQQLHRFGPSTCVTGQFPGTQQTPPIPATAGATPPQQTQSPRQIVGQPSTLFLTPLNRHPHTTNLRPANTTPIRPPPKIQTCGQSPQSRPLVSSVTRSPVSQRRVLVSRVVQTPGRHMRPLASSGIRSSTSPAIIPSNPASSSGPPGSRTYHRILPVQHVTSSVPLPCKLPVPQPQSSLPQSRGPQDKLNDNVKTLKYNDARALNILKTPEFPGGCNAAQPPSAHELVYLSDDD